ncbi:MAG: AI-2E family transporter [Dysgonamonadaceae bacterium]|nr:AI-2E family transporter [Dysgonamonadaceae bacterium]
MNTSRPYTFDRVVRMLIGLTVLVILGLLINKLKTVLLPFAIGWLLAYLLHPVVLFFQYKLRVRNRVLSILCTVLLLSFITFCIAWFIIPLIGNEIDKFVQLVTSYTQNFHTINLLPEAWQTAIQMYLSQLDIEAVLSDQNIQNILRNAAPKLWSFVNSSLTFILGFVVIFVVFLYFIFISLDYDKINAGFIRAIPAKYRPLAIEIITDMKNGMNKYFRGQALIALINGILFSIGFHIIGLPMGILLGIIMGILNLIPYMQLLGYIPALLLALLQSAETGQSYGSILLWILALAIFVQALQEIFLMPKIMGKATGLNPAIILLALSVWGTLLGLLGMIIALPVTALLVSYYKRFVLKENPLGEEIDSTESEISEDEL